MQALLFGKVKLKEPFIAKVDEGKTGSFNVIEALWQLSTGTQSRSDFLKSAQSAWSKTYRDHLTARKALLARAEALRQKATDYEQSRTFVSVVSREQALKDQELQRAAA